MTSPSSNRGSGPDPTEKTEAVEYNRTQLDERSDGDQELLPGVVYMKAFSKEITFMERCILFGSMFLVGYAFGLDGLVRSTYQAYATSSYAQHSLLSTINVIRGVIAAVVQPMVAKLSDMFGRLTLFLILTVFYVVGTVVEACATNVQSFAAGALLYQIGYICTLLVFEIVIADITSIRSRVFFVFVPNMPYLINAWISGNVTEAVLGKTTWQWGVGMWCIIYPVCTIPFITIMVVVGRRVSRALPSQAKTKKSLGGIEAVRDIFWKLDIPGVFFLTAALSLVLIPLTLAGGVHEKWKTAGIITPLVLGFVLIPVFVLWERYTTYPMFPLSLMRDRGVWTAICVALFMTFSWYVQADFLYTILLVAFDFSIATATRIASVYSFCAVVGGVTTGLVVKKVRRLKPFVIGGICFWIVAYGILFHFRGSPTSSSKAGVVAGQVLLGLAGGCFPYPNMAAAQALTKRKNIAVITSVLLTVNNIGNAIGNAVSGAIWTQVLYGELAKNLAPNAELAVQVYASPLTVVPAYPVGTAERAAIIESYRHIQRLLIITGICLSVPLLGFALLLRDTKLPKRETLWKRNNFGD